MEWSDQLAAVSQMQHYIMAHSHEEITLEDLAHAAGYSKYHALRIFKEVTGQTPFAMIRAMRLTKAAQALQNAESKVLDVALHSGFDSHDGFTRAFYRRFTVTPHRYQNELPAVNWFVPHPIEAYYTLKEGKTTMDKEKVSRTVTVSVVQRPARKLIFLRYQAADYFSACAEVGCEWEGFYNSIPEAFDSAASGRLPEFLIQPGTSGNAFLVEVPLDYNKPLPAGYEIAELPPCTYLYFNGMPFEDENDFSEAIEIVNEAIKQYPFEQYGWKRAVNAPYLGMGASAKRGARSAVPVEKI